MKLSGILFGSETPSVLADFYTKMLGDPSWHDGDWYGYSVGNEIGIGPHSEVKGQNNTPGRIMVMFETEDIHQEFDRIKALGATVIAEPYHPSQADEMWLATFADPDGNYFQIGTPWTPPT